MNIKKNNKKYIKYCIGLLGLLQTKRKQGPFTDKQGQRDFDQKDYTHLRLRVKD